MGKIKALLVEYDVGGVVVLSSQTALEYINFDPSWSTIQTEANGRTHVKLRAADKISAENSIGHVLGVAEVMEKVTDMHKSRAKALRQALDGKISIDHVCEKL